MSSSSFHVCANCDGSCERVARAALASTDWSILSNEARGDVPTLTPWGQPSHVENIKVGIVGFETSSHGGWWVAPGLRAKIPACIQLTTYGQLGVQGWYEEDSDVSWVVACFPEMFGNQKATAACGILSKTFDCLRKGMGMNTERNWIMALRCAYAKNGLAYGWQEIEGGAAA